MYEEAKVYYDGSHYIAIPHTTRIVKPRCRHKEQEIVINEEGTFADNTVSVLGSSLTEVDDSEKLLLWMIGIGKEKDKRKVNRFLWQIMTR